MFSIGVFARLGEVSIRTLRHYVEIGLLRPAQVVALKELLRGVEARLRYIEKEGVMPADDIKARTIPATPVVAIAEPARQPGSGEIRRASHPRSDPSRGAVHVLLRDRR